MQRDELLRAPILRGVFVLFCVLGLVASVMLTQLHVKAHTQPNATSFCSVHSKVDCLSVAESPWAVLWGVPVSVWALLAYTALILGVLVPLVAHLVRWRRSRGSGADSGGGAGRGGGAGQGRTYHTMPGLMLLLSAFAFCASLGMAFISHFIVKSLCLVCAVLYVVNTALLVLSWLTCRRHGGVWGCVSRDLALLRRNGTNLVGFVSPLLVVAGGLMAWYPSYWVLNEPVGPGKLGHGVTREGHPWIGATDPLLTIHEFSDYQCGFCRSFNARLRALLEKPQFRDKVRVVHYNYPLDDACNPTVNRRFHLRACELARAAVCAGEQGKFWHMHDMMFRRQRRRGGPNLRGLAAKLSMDVGRFESCLESDRAKKKVAQDIATGERMAKECTGEGITGTPYYVFERKGEELRKGYAYEKVIARALKQIVLSQGPEGLDHGSTADGHPWIGARRPRLTIFELSDYECYFCKRRHAALRQLLKKHRELREQVRLVHLQYPLGHQCNRSVKRPQHRRACVMARAALCAKEQGRFWEMNDALYRLFRRRRPPNMVRVARAAGLDMTRFGRCLNTQAIQTKLLKEIDFGEGLGRRDGRGVPGAPVYFFQAAGRSPERVMPPTERSIRAALKKAGPAPSSGSGSVAPPMGAAPAARPEEEGAGRSGAAPSGAGRSGAAPSGAGRSGAAPSGAGRSGAAPSGAGR